jgi:hypothetical protein
LGAYGILVEQVDCTIPLSVTARKFNIYMNMDMDMDMDMDKPTSRLRSSLSSAEFILLFKEYCLEYRVTVVWRVILGEREEA